MTLFFRMGQDGESIHDGVIRICFTTKPGTLCSYVSAGRDGLFVCSGRDETVLAAALVVVFFVVRSVRKLWFVVMVLVVLVGRSIS